MSFVYEDYVEETLAPDGQLQDIKFHVPENFNFAYDVVDVLAKKSPDRLAMLWCNDEGEERKFTFSDISRLSNKAANVFRNAGIKKGDMVMLVLKRHYEFWYAIMGLCKLGAVAIPGTDMLVTKDLVYRFNSAGVCAIVCTADGTIAKSVDEAQAESPTLKHKFGVRGHMDGWDDFGALVEAALINLTGLKIIGAI